MLSMLISGGMSGLAGAIELMGVHHRLVEEVSPEYGFTAIIIAVLGRGQSHPRALCVLPVLDPDGRSGRYAPFPGNPGFRGIHSAGTGTVVRIRQ